MSVQCQSLHKLIQSKIEDLKHMNCCIETIWG